MKTTYRLWSVVGTASLLLILCLLTLTAHAAPPAPTTPTLDTVDAPMGGFVADGGAVNAAGQNGEAPSLAVNLASGELWVALVQNRQVIVSKFVSATQSWVQQGNSLNFNTSGSATQPALAFGGADHNTPWVTWQETISGVHQILAARLDGNQWTFTGNAIKGLPVLNQLSEQLRYDPALAVGATLTGEAPLPWAAWGEGNGFVGQLAIQRAVSDVTALGGIRWQQVMTPTALDVAYKPDLVFSGSANQTLWLAWSTINDVGSAQVFVARALSDTAALGGFRWEKINGQANCQQANPASSCALNQADHFSTHLRLASGRLAGETQPTPWVVFVQTPANEVAEIHVMRLDEGTPADPTDDRFIPVGDAVNTQCLQRDQQTAHSGTEPDIYFVGNVPHVAWLEAVNGQAQLLVCHLADARPGQERWDLDTVMPLNRNLDAVPGVPSLGADATTPYVAWQEAGEHSNVFVAHRYPAGPSWGRNYPPFIRTISWSRNLVGQAFDTRGIEQALKRAGSTRPFTLTTSCDHVNGWDHIQEIQFKIANPKLTAFSGKYVAASNQLFVEDPSRPGVFLGGFQPGTDQQVETTNVTFYVDQTRVRAHGTGSAVLDIDWIMSFKDPLLFQDVKQMINIVYDNGEATGFFETGLLSFDYRMYLPVVTK